MERAKQISNRNNNSEKVTLVRKEKILVKNKAKVTEVRAVKNFKE